MKEHVDRDRLVELTGALVAVDTSNPPGNEVAVSNILRDALTRMGPVLGRSRARARAALADSPAASP